VLLSYEHYFAELSSELPSLSVTVRQLTAQLNPETGVILRETNREFLCWCFMYLEVDSEFCFLEFYCITQSGAFGSVTGSVLNGP
jgi:hypothetical protein